MKRARRLTALMATAALLCIAVPLTLTPADATQCPSTNVGGTTIGWIEFDDTRAPLKDVNYPAGGALNPPASAAVAGVSTRHKPLLAKSGTTVVAWHVRYGKGCNGSLNPILKMKSGDSFDVISTSGKRQTFKLSDRAKVKRGKYKPEWFRTTGPRQLSLFTCADPLHGAFHSTTALIAVPVASSSP